MTHKCNFFHEIDLFGKEAELYFKGEYKKSTLIGRIFSVLYIIIYFSFFTYKLIRMLLKIDVQFYQTTAYKGETPSIHITNDIFYGGFALAHPRTLLPFIDETIYYMELWYRDCVKKGNVWSCVKKQLELEKCQLNKFNSRFWDLLKDKPLEQMYCPKEIDITLEGHTTYDVNRYLYIGFYPCVNSTTRNNCRPKEEIDIYLKQAYVTFQMQDIELTPQIYKTPIRYRTKELNAPASKNLFHSINAYFQIVIIETDTDYLGFEALRNIDIKKYLKYEIPTIVNRVNDVTDYIIGQPLCDVSIQLSEQILTINRTYTKLVEVLGDVGGLMEIIFSFFNIICSLITKILYEKSLVNNLFEFDLNKKVILIKENNKKNNEKYYFKPNEGIDIYNPKNTSKKTKLIKINSICINEQTGPQTKIKIKGDSSDRNEKIKNEVLLISSNDVKIPKMPKKIKKIKSKKKRLRKDNNNNILYINTMDKLDSDNLNSNEDNNKKLNKNNEKQKIDKIKISKLNAFFCFLCIRKRKNLQNIVMDESMNIITKNLDILNVFKKLYKDEKEEKKIENSNIIEMSSRCKKRLRELNTEYNDT